MHHIHSNVSDINGWRQGWAPTLTFWAGRSMLKSTPAQLKRSSFVGWDRSTIKTAWHLAKGSLAVRLRLALRGISPMWLSSHFTEYLTDRPASNWGESPAIEFTMRMNRTWYAMMSLCPTLSDWAPSKTTRRPLASVSLPRWGYNGQWRRPMSWRLFQCLLLRETSLAWYL